MLFKKHDRLEYKGGTSAGMGEKRTYEEMNPRHGNRPNRFASQPSALSCSRGRLHRYVSPI